MTFSFACLSAMPKVLAYTPEWLSRNNPGFQVFNTRPTPRQRSSTQLENGDGSNSDYVGPNRTTARRGAEVFTVVGKHIRWADLSVLKENFEELKGTPSKAPKSTGPRTGPQIEKDGPEDGSYRVCKYTGKRKGTLVKRGRYRFSQLHLANQYDSCPFLQMVISSP